VRVARWSGQWLMRLLTTSSYRQATVSASLAAEPRGNLVVKRIPAAVVVERDGTLADQSTFSRDGEAPVYGGRERHASVQRTVTAMVPSGRGPCWCTLPAM
jgi:hypothetical protein